MFTDIQIGLLGIGAVLILLALRVPIGVALGAVSLVGIAQLRGVGASLSTLKSIPYDFGASFTLSAIPMFLLMGAVAHHAGVSAALFRAARVWFGRLPGGLAIASNFACAGFAAASGSSAATAAAMGRIAIPEMLDRGYDKGLATGVVASAGTLGTMIPPSILFVLYGIFAEVSISRLLIAGIFPGILTAVVYATMIYTRCRISPRLAPPVEIQVTLGEKIRSLGGVWPVLLLIVGIIGGMLAGIVTPTEAGAFGAFLAFVIAFIQRKLTWAVVRDSLVDAAVGTSSLLFVAIGAILLTHFMALSGVPEFSVKIFGTGAIDPLVLIIGSSVIYLILGMFLDPLGVLLLTLPVLLPLFEALNLDLVWLGVIVVKYMEIGLLTPPVGFNVYVIKGVVGDKVELEEIFKGVTWFLVCEFFIMVLLIGFPQISLYLPNLMH